MIILVISACIGVYAIAWGCVLFNFICVFINLYPNKRLLDYGVGEQIIDAVPTFVLSLLMGLMIYWIQWLSISNFLILLLQFIIGVLVYFGLSLLFKDESLMYVVQFIKENKSKI